MSFRTVAQLDLNRADVERDIADRDRMHKRLMSMFPEGLGNHPRQAVNLLFVVNTDNGELLMQSDLRPVLGPLKQARAGYFLDSLTKPTDEVGMVFETGDTVEFRLWFAAQERTTGSKSRSDLEDPAVIKAKAKGVLAKVGLDVETIVVQDLEPINSAKRKVSYRNALLVGSGVVTDAEDLKAAIVRGVGGGRLWGSGVLLVSRA